MKKILTITLILSLAIYFLVPNKAQLAPQAPQKVQEAKKVVSLIKKPAITPVLAKSQDIVKTTQSSVKTTSSLSAKASVTSATTPATTSSTTISKPIDNEKLSKWSHTLDITFNTDSKQVADTSKTYDMGVWYFLNYAVSDEYNARLWVIINKDLAKSYEESLGDTRLTISKKGTELRENLSFHPSTTLVLPTSEKSKRNQELNFGVEVNPALSYQLSEKLALSYLPRFAKNFHEYTTTRDNNTNTEYKIVQFYSANYSVIDKWNLAGTLIYSNSWSYEGTRRDPQYQFISEVAYQASSTLSMALGVVQGGSVFDREQGPDETVKIYDINESSYYVNVAYKF